MSEGRSPSAHVQLIVLLVPACQNLAGQGMTTGSFVAVYVPLCNIYVAHLPNHIRSSFPCTYT